MIQKLLLISVFLTAPVPALAGQLISRVELERYALSLIAAGERHMAKCSLDLVAESRKFRRAISLKRPQYNCMLYGAVQITPGFVPGEDTVLVFVEASRGGDGDHTPPIVEVFRLDPTGFKKVGEVELLNTTYVRDGGRISALTGNALFDFCDVCDGWETSSEVVPVPAQVTILRDQLVVRPILDEPARAALLTQFEAAKQAALAERKDAKYGAYVRRLERRFHDFLRE